MATYELGISSSDAIELFPEFDSELVGNMKLESKHRTQGVDGVSKLYKYTWGTYYKARIGVEYLSAANASIINSWWESDAELLFFVTSSTVTAVESVTIVNKEAPFMKYNMPYDDQMSGVIHLEGY